MRGGGGVWGGGGYLTLIVSVGPEWIVHEMSAVYDCAGAQNMFSYLILRGEMHYVCLAFAAGVQYTW